MDIVVDELIIEEDRPDHIAKHDVTVDEVLEVVFGDYVVAKGKSDRILLTGKTLNQRLITVIVGQRAGINKFGLITPRTVKRKEKVLYQEKFIGDQK